MSIIDEIEYKKEHQELLDSKFSFNSRWYSDYKSYILVNSIRISKEIFPEINTILEETVFKIDNKSTYEFFITSDNSFNAKCISIDEKSAIIVINSKVIELLDTKELAFIVGHEIAHHYYKHYSFAVDVDKIENEQLKLSYLSVLRDMELSCDRLGLMCVDNFEVAARAIIKIVSGLSDKFIKNNFKKYLSQLKEITHAGFVEEQYQTHNNWLIRLQCLYHFSNSDIYNQESGNSSVESKPLSEINKIIEDGLSKLIYSSGSNNFKKESNDMLCWLLLYLVITYDKKLFPLIKEMLSEYDQKKIDKIHIYLLNNSQSNIDKKITTLIDSYKQLPLKNKNDALGKIDSCLKKYDLNNIIIESKFNQLKKELI